MILYAIMSLHNPTLKSDRIKCVFICVQLFCEKRKFFEGIITNLE